jgi:hypothetical protein
MKDTEKFRLFPAGQGRFMGRPRYSDNDGLWTWHKSSFLDEASRSPILPRTHQALGSDSHERFQDYCHLRPPKFKRAVISL